MLELLVSSVSPAISFLAAFFSGTGCILVGLGGEVMCSIALVLIVMMMLVCIFLVLPNRLDKSAARNWV